MRPSFSISALGLSELFDFVFSFTVAHKVLES